MFQKGGSQWGGFHFQRKSPDKRLLRRTPMEHSKELQLTDSLREMRGKQSAIIKKAYKNL